MPDIYQKINEIMKELTAVEKSKENKDQHFKYRGIDDVMNALHPLLSKHGVFIVPEVLDRKREERATKSGGTLAFTTVVVKYLFCSASNGSYFSATVAGEGMDMADKSTNKAMACAMKYVLFQVFCIPTEEMKDPDEETPTSPEPKDTSHEVTETSKGQKRMETSRSGEIVSIAKEYGAKQGVAWDTWRELCKKNHIATKALSEYLESEYIDLTALIEQALVDLGYCKAAS